MAASNTEEILSVHDVSLRFGGIQALSHVSFSLQYNEILGIIGPNGGGKSTLLNVISGVYAPSFGSVVFAGKPLECQGCDVIARSGIARTFQTPRLFEHLDLSEHLFISMSRIRPKATLWAMLAPPQRPGESAIEEGQALLQQVGLRAHLHSFPHHLSYGQRRLLEIAMCLASCPYLLLLDEPTAGLNESESHALCLMLQEVVSARNLTLVVIDHNIAFIRKLCPRILVLDQGNTICSGPADDVLQDERVHESYLGT